MSWTVDHNEVLNVIEVTFVGRVDGADLKESTSEGLRLAKEKRVRDVLIDCREADFAASLMDFYDRPSHQYSVEEADPRGFCAVVRPKNTKDQAVITFYETVSRSKGWRVWSFVDRESAVDWLRAGQG